MKKKILILVGVLSPTIYFAASFVGGFANEGYSHIVDSVSDLLIIGTNSRQLVDVMMLFSNLATLISCIAIFIYFRKAVSKSMKVGMILLASTGFSNLMSTYVFRLEESVSGMTFSTAMHIAFVACSAIFAIVGALFIAFNYNKHFVWKGVKPYTIVSLLILAVGGAISPIIMSSGLEIIGIVERISIIAYHQWFIVMIIKFYNESKHLKI